jgi:hypothetical protein
MRTLTALALLATLLVASPAQAMNLEEDLIAAAVHGKVTTVQTLLNEGASVNSPDGNGTTPLLAAVRNGHLPVVQLLLEYGASPTEPDLKGHTAIAVARENGNSRLVAMLDQQTGLAYAYTKLNHRPGHYRWGGGWLEIKAQKSGALVMVFSKYTMPYSEAAMIARILGGPGLDYGTRVFGPGYVMFPAVGNNKGYKHVDAKVMTWDGAWAGRVVVTLK